MRSWVHEDVLQVQTIVVVLVEFFFDPSRDCIVSCFKKCWYFPITDQLKFTIHPQNVTTTAGDNVTLSCDASGNPQPTFSWDKDGSPVNTTATPRITFSADKKQLTITNLDKADSGSQYQCVANNSIGQAITSNTASLNVQCKNNFTLYLVSIETKLVGIDAGK